MNRRRTTKRYAQMEHNNLYQDSIIEFTKKKLSYILSNIHCYEQEQLNLTPSSIKLLNFAYDKSDQTKVLENKNNANQNSNIQHSKTSECKQAQSDSGKQEEPNQVIQQTLKGEKEELDDQMEKNYQDTLSNLRKENLLLAKSSVKIHQRDEHTEWFVKVDQMDTDRDNYKQEIYYNPYSSRQYKTIPDGGISKIIIVDTTILKLDDYHKFDDYFSTSILYFNAPVYLTITASLDSFLSLLTVIKVLLLLKSYSTLNIVFGLNCSYERNSNEFKLVEQLVETIFRIIFSNRGLQLLDMQIDQRLAQSVAKGMSHADLENSHLRVFKSRSPSPGKSQELNDYFYQISKLKKLYYFNINQVLINENNIENFCNILRNVTSADLSIVRTQIKFDFPKLEKLQLTYTFYSCTEVKINYDNFQNAINLNHLQVHHTTIGPEENPYYDRTSRKQILLQAKIQQNKKNQANQKLNEQKIKTKEEEEIEKEETEFEEEFVNGPDETPYTLNSLLNLKKLLYLNIKLRYDQNMINSFNQFLKTSTSIMDINSFFDAQDYDNVKKDLDFRDIIPSMNSCKSLTKFNFHFLLGSIEYNQYKSKYSFRLNCQFQTEQQKIIFNPCSFTFDDDVTDITLTINCGEDKFLERLDEICQSVSNIKNVEQLKLNITCGIKVYKQLEINKVNNSSLLLFGHLSNLKNLSVLDILLPLNQDIIDSLASMVEQQKCLKNFQIGRQKVKQYYLDYTKLFKAVSDSSCIQQISLHLSIENMKIIVEDHHIVWEEAKLKLFYLQICKMINNSKNLKLLCLQEKFNEKGRLLILNQLLQLESTKEFKFLDQIEQNHYNQEQNSQEYKKTMSKVTQKGLIFTKKDYRKKGLVSFSYPPFQSDYQCGYRFV